MLGFAILHGPMARKLEQLPMTDTRPAAHHLEGAPAVLDSVLWLSGPDALLRCRRALDDRHSCCCPCPGRRAPDISRCLPPWRCRDASHGFADASPWRRKRSASVVGVGSVVSRAVLCINYRADHAQATRGTGEAIRVRRLTDKLLLLC